LPATAGEFPFDRELLLDAYPMKGSKQIPSLGVTRSGRASIVLWCNSVQAQVVLAGDTITILTGPLTERQCPSERMRADDDLLAALLQVSSWRSEGEALVLRGARTMRFRPSTH